MNLHQYISYLSWDSGDGNFDSGVLSTQKKQLFQSLPKKSIQFNKEHP